MSCNWLYGLVAFEIVAGAPATAQTMNNAADPPPIEAMEWGEPVTDDEECNLPCQIAKSPLPPGGGGGIAAMEADPVEEGMSIIELGVTRPSAGELKTESMSDSFETQQ